MAEFVSVCQCTGHWPRIMPTRVHFLWPLPQMIMNLLASESAVLSSVPEASQVALGQRTRLPMQET